MKKCCLIMKEDIKHFVREFHMSERFPKEMTASFLALVPKVQCPQKLEEHIPICLVGSMYKVIEKIQEERLKRVIGKVISVTHSAFIPGRQILDGVFVINELLDYAKRFRRDCLLFKLDFTQAYICVDWDYLRYMLGRLGFGFKWCKWMEA